MSTDFLTELACVMRQTNELLEKPEHRDTIAQGADLLAKAIDYMEREPARLESNSDEGFDLGSWVLINGTDDEIPFMYNSINPLTRW